MSAVTVFILLSVKVETAFSGPLASRSFPVKYTIIYTLIHLQNSNQTCFSNVAMCASEHLCNIEEKMSQLPLLGMYVLFALYNLTLNYYYTMLGVNN